MKKITAKAPFLNCKGGSGFVLAIVDEIDSYLILSE